MEALASTIFCSEAGEVQILLLAMKIEPALLLCCMWRVDNIATIGGKINSSRFKIENEPAIISIWIRIASYGINSQKEPSIEFVINEH